MSLYKLRALANEGIRLRTACDLHVEHEAIDATTPPGWLLPALEDLREDVKAAISECGDRLVVTEVTFEDELKKGKDQDDAGLDDAGQAGAEGE